MESEERLQAMFEEMGLGSESKRSYFRQFETAATLPPARSPIFIRIAAWTTVDPPEEKQDAELA
jgi:hypothetical protein